ncbi:hypothetical protein AUK22_09645 [bacterium CG2_30_54_10]|nr:MAG: hypothetical protein AUK22_09645 [bacterium CG2_30_54_10]
MFDASFPRSSLVLCNRQPIPNVRYPARLGKDIAVIYAPIRRRWQGSSQILNRKFSIPHPITFPASQTIRSALHGSEEPDTQGAE